MFLDIAPPPPRVHTGQEESLGRHDDAVKLIRRAVALRPDWAEAHSNLGVALNAVMIATLVWWAADEVLRGVNPWRRFLGAGVLTFAVVRLTVG